MCSISLHMYQQHPDRIYTEREDLVNLETYNIRSIQHMKKKHFFNMKKFLRTLSARHKR